MSIPWTAEDIDDMEIADNTGAMSGRGGLVNEVPLGLAGGVWLNTEFTTDLHPDASKLSYSQSIADKEIIQDYLKRIADTCKVYDIPASLGSDYVTCYHKYHRFPITRWWLSDTPQFKIKE